MSPTAPASTKAPEPARLKLLYQIAQALEHIHAQRIAKQELTQGLTGAAVIAGGSQQSAQFAAMLGRGLFHASDAVQGASQEQAGLGRDGRTCGDQGAQTIRRLFERGFVSPARSEEALGGQRFDPGGQIGLVDREVGWRGGDDRVDALLVEAGPAEQVIDRPATPYTRALMAAAFDLKADMSGVVST